MKPILRKIVVVLALAVAWPLDASGSTPERVQARAHYDRAKQLVRAGDFARAAQEFEKAYEILPRFDVLYNLGQAYVALDRKVEAVDALSRYLLYGAEKVPPARRDEVQEQVARLTAELTSEGVPARALPEKSAPPDRGPPLAATVTRAGPTSPEPSRPEPTTVTSPEHRSSAVTPERRPAGDTPSQPATPPIGRTIGFTMMGAGIVLGVIATVVWADNNANFSAWERRQTELSQRWDQAIGTPAALDAKSAQDENDELGRSIRAQDNTARILAGSAAMLVLTGWTFALITYAPKSNRQPGVAVEARLGGVNMSGRF